MSGSLDGSTDAARDAGRADDPDWFRRVLGHYPTGVSVVTGIAPDGAPAGLAVGSFTSVSLDPPLVGFLPSVQSTSWPRIRPSGRFCVNILAADQESICRAFAATSGDKFEHTSWHPAPSGAPIIDEAVAWIDCELEAEHEAGDHAIVLGRVRHLHIQRQALPLLFFQGGYGRFSTRSLGVGDARFGLSPELLQSARPLMEGLTEQTGGLVVVAHCDGRELIPLATAGIPGDDRALSLAIGQRQPVVPPVGIWWMAFAAPGDVEGWLEPVADAALRAGYGEALARVRAQGYSLDEELGVTGVPPEGAGDPRGDAPGGARADGGPSMWAPVFAPSGEIALGVMVTGSGEDEGETSAALLRTAAGIGGLIARELAPRHSRPLA